MKILPYLGESELFEEFHLDEPWDSTHNRKLIDRIPLAFSAGAKPVGGVTRFLAPVGENTLWEDRGGRQIRRISDGTAYSIGVVYVSADRGVIWTKPEDFEVDPQDCRVGLKAEGGNGYFVGFIDGHYAQLPPKTEESVLRGDLTISGREQLPLAGALLPELPRGSGP